MSSSFENSPETNDTSTGLRHSKLGISSFVLSLAAFVGAFAIIVYAGYMETSTAGGLESAEQMALTIGLGIMAMVGLLMISLILGIVGLFQSGRRKILAGIGVGISGSCIVLIVLIIWIGITSG